MSTVKLVGQVIDGFDQLKQELLANELRQLALEAPPYAEILADCLVRLVIATRDRQSRAPQVLCDINMNRGRHVVNISGCWPTHRQVFSCDEVSRWLTRRTTR